jgi:hypothetical protein
VAARRKTGLWIVLTGGVLGTALSFLTTLGGLAGAIGAWAEIAAWAICVVGAVSIAVFYALAAPRHDAEAALNRHLERQNLTLAPHATRPPRPEPQRPR